MIIATALRCARSLRTIGSFTAPSHINMTAPHAFSRPSIIFSFSDKPASDVVDEESNEEFQAKKKAAGGISNNLSDEQALEMIAKWVTTNKVCLFMKGEPKEPRCGFSNFVVQTLKFYKIKDYKSIDVLKYEHIRKQAKVYSNWPTFPQLFIDGKFVGGSDIVSEMHKDGSFKELLLKAKLIEE